MSRATRAAPEPARSARDEGRCRRRRDRQVRASTSSLGTIARRRAAASGVRRLRALRGASSSPPPPGRCRRRPTASRRSRACRRSPTAGPRGRCGRSEDAVLSSYGWVDQHAGHRAHPDRARRCELVAERGPAGARRRARRRRAGAPSAGGERSERARWRWPLLRRPCAPAAGGRSDGARPRRCASIGFDQRLGETLPLDLALPRRGRARRCGSATTSAGKPVVLSLVYYDCPMLCTVTLERPGQRAQASSTFDAGTEFEVVTVSFDPSETPELAAPKKKAVPRALQAPGRPTRAGTSSPATRRRSTRLTEAVGFRYAWDAETQAVRARHRHRRR